MLVFVDESEWPRPKDPAGYTVWGAVALHPSKSRNFVREVFNLEKKFWKVNEPYQFEIKGRMLLNERGMGSPKKCEFCEEVISLCKLSGVKAFAVGLKNTGNALSGLTEPIVYKAYSLLLERIEGMMAEDYGNETAIIALDSADEATDTKRALAFGNYIYGTEAGKNAIHVMETPFFVSSKATTGIQIADLVAYAFAQQKLGKAHIRDICGRIRELEWQSKRTDVDYPLHGFRFLDMQKPPARTTEPGANTARESTTEVR